MSQRVVGDVAELLASALGRDQAIRLVADAAVTRRIRVSDPWSRDAALSILECIAAQSGLVGIAARFACVQVQLMSD
jgi:hypothetical protein